MGWCFCDACSGSPIRVTCCIVANILSKSLKERVEQVWKIFGNKPKCKIQHCCYDDNENYFSHCRNHIFVHVLILDVHGISPERRYPYTLYSISSTEEVVSVYTSQDTCTFICPYLWKNLAWYNHCNILISV